jgi:hypothetical protein
MTNLIPLVSKFFHTSSSNSFTGKIDGREFTFYHAHQFVAGSREVGNKEDRKWDKNAELNKVPCHEHILGRWGEAEV